MMRMRRVFSFLLAVALLSGLCACGGSAETASANPNPELTAPASFAPVSAAPASTDPEPTDPEPTPTLINIDIPWTEVTYSIKDSSGYTFDITLKLSPWILLSDTDLINFAWDKVGGGNALPQFDNWGFTHSGNGYKCSYLDYTWDYGSTSTSLWYMTDMYYSVGTVTIQNTTSGFDITPNEPRNVKIQWGSNGPPYCLGRMFYSNETTTRARGLYINATITSNTGGSVPVILMTAENISPNTPDGVTESILSDNFVFDVWYNPFMTTLESENIQVHLGILKSDGEYITE